VKLWGRGGAKSGNQAAGWSAFAVGARHAGYAKVDQMSPRGATMNEDVFNTSIRKFLKQVGVTSQREIEKAVRKAIAEGRIKGDETLSARATVTIGALGFQHEVAETLELQ
jgi:hypothetical protein